MSAVEILDLVLAIAYWVLVALAIVFVIRWMEDIRKDVRSIRDNVAHLRWKEENDS